MNRLVPGILSLLLLFVPSILTAWESPCPDDMMYIAGGPFQMGGAGSQDPGTGAETALPVHEVTLSPYCIDRTEVTVEAYRACGSACTVPGNAYPYGDPLASGSTCLSSVFEDPSNFLKDNPKLPANCLTWQMASTYCSLVGKRLPTEAEWERAAHGSPGYEYPWGNVDASCEVVVMDETSYGGDAPGCDTGGSMPVCSKAPQNRLFGARRIAALLHSHPGLIQPRSNLALSHSSSHLEMMKKLKIHPDPLEIDTRRLCDLGGNVWEWVSDWYAPYPSESVTDPQGPSSGDLKILRGGSYLEDVFGLDTNYRLSILREWGYIDAGVRCAKSLP